jgi:hypothetical protein
MTSDLIDLPPPVGTEEQNLKLASEIAAVTLLTAEHKIAKLLADPTLTFNQMMAIGEHAYKVSGMAKKQEPMEQQGKFVFNINFGGGGSVSIEKLNTTEPIDVTPTPMSLAKDAASIDFSSAPEFR